MRGKTPAGGSSKVFQVWKLGGCAIVVLASALVARAVYGVQKTQKAQAFIDYLVPGDKPTPKNRCQDPQRPEIKYNTVILGPIAAASGPFSSDVLRVDGEVVLHLDFDAEEKMAVTTDIYDGNHDIVVSIDRNHYHVDQSVFEMKKVDDSSLEVTLRHDKEKVLDISYVNPHTITIKGVFRTKKAELRVTSEGVYRDGKPVGVSNICSVGFGTAFAF